VAVIRAGLNEERRKSGTFFSSAPQLLGLSLSKDLCVRLLLHDLRVLHG